MSIATMDKVLKSVLSQGNKEQNQAYPPNIFTTHFNLVSSWMLDEVARLFPTSQPVVDTVRPFLKRQTVPVKNGMVEFPVDYRHLVAMGIFVTDDFKESCGCDEDYEAEDCQYEDDPTAPTPEQRRSNQERGKCISNSVRIVDIDQWDDLTRHTYKRPTLRKPIACIFQGEGIKICPFDVPNVEVRYIMQPNEYSYGYTMNPDDTYSFDPLTTKESQWPDNALQYLVKGITTLYSIYLKDTELRDANLELKKAGIF